MGILPAHCNEIRITILSTNQIWIWSLSPITTIFEHGGTSHQQLQQYCINTRVLQYFFSRIVTCKQKTCHGKAIGSYVTMKIL